MKILNAKQIRETDAYTIQHEPILSIDLMERAATSFTEWLVKKFDTECKVAIICGTGNNGGDGLAVGRMLVARDYSVEAFIVGSGSGTDDFQVNKERLLRDIEIPMISGVEDIPDLEVYDIIIDAIFGSGLTRPATGLFASVFEAVNHSSVVKISIDISSGLYCDNSSIQNDAIRSDFTVSFQLPKMALLVPENDEYVGKWEVVDIGLDKDFIKREVTPYHYLTSEFLTPFVRPRKQHAHKGNFGKGLLATGSYGKMGASVLASRAFMRGGAGLLTVLAPRCGYTILQTAVPEAMVNVNGDDTLSGNIPDLEEYDAIGMGPGIGMGESTTTVICKILEQYEKPVVIDADGLNILAQNRQFLELLPAHSILTPHPKEFERLTGHAKDDYERIEKLIVFSRNINGYTVLKGAHTAIATPEGNIYFNSTGNPGMATGGSGDVLTGIITSLLAQGQSPFHAAVLGVYLHGLAGDLAVEFLGEEGMIASDIVEYLPDALNSVHTA